MMSPGHILSPGKVAMTPQQTREQKKEEKQTWKKTTSEIMRLNNVCSMRAMRERANAKKKTLYTLETNRVCELRKRSGNST